MPYRNDPESLAEFIRTITPRLGEMETRARENPSAVQTVLRDAIDQLRSTVEELEVVREELLLQNEALVRQQSSLGHDALWYRDLFERSPGAALATDAYGKILACNRAALRLLGSRGRDLSGKPLAVFVDHENRGDLRRRLNHLAGRESAMTWELVLRPRESLPVMVRASVSASSPPGEEERIVLHWTLRDVTEERRAASAHAETDELLRTLVHAVPLGVALLDLDGTVLLWNRAAERLLGWAEDEVAGKPLPGVSEGAQGQLIAAREDEPLHLETLARRADGSSVRLALSVSAVGDGAGGTRGAVVFLAQAGEEERTPSPEGGSWTREEALESLTSWCPAERDVQGRIRAWIAAGLHLGYLRPGARLPSIREVSVACHADHRAVSLAYRTLAAESVLEIRNRHGAYVAERPEPAAEAPCESAGWLAGVLAEACALGVRAPLVPDMVRRWTSSTTVRCACVESTEDDLAAMTAELRHQWGLDTYAVPLRVEGEPAPGRRGEEPLSTALRGAVLVATTRFHEAAVRAAAVPLGIPVVVVSAHPDVVAAAEERLRGGTLTAVVADPRFGDRLRALRGAERDGALRVVAAGDGPAVAALDPAEPVLLTRAAQQRLPGLRARLLVPVAHFLSPAPAREIADVLIRQNMAAERAG
jgi:PAS domain S-box-containing protein